VGYFDLEDNSMGSLTEFLGEKVRVRVRVRARVRVRIRRSPCSRASRERS
jgi:hypothetical protein